MNRFLLLKVIENTLGPLELIEEECITFDLAYFFFCSRTDSSSFLELVLCSDVLLKNSTETHMCSDAEGLTES